MGIRAFFTYGADGLRRRSVVNGSTTDFVLNGDNAVRTLVAGAADRTWLHGARGPEYERIGTGSPLWNLYDGLGSVLGTVDPNGNLISTRKFDVYGAVRGSTGPGGTKHKFCGSLGHPSEDETGLIYMRARWMDGAAGRFASEDPAQDGSNWLSYVQHCPTRFADRTGLVLLTDLMFGDLDLDESELMQANASQIAKGWAERAIQRALQKWAGRFGPVVDELFGIDFSISTTPGRLQLVGIDGRYSIGLDFTQAGQIVVKTYQWGRHILPNVVYP